MAYAIKYQIFVSSTFEDLYEWRRELIEHILAQDHIPAGMELFAAGNEQDLKVIRAAIDQCDIYVVLVGARYGSVVPATGKSYTQVEFEYARSIGKPILAFLLEDNDFKILRDALRSDDPDRSHDKALKDFRHNVKQISAVTEERRLVGLFSLDGGKGGLKAQFANALVKLLNSSQFDMPGWVRLPVDVGRNPFIRRIVGRLSSFEKLSHRCTVDNPALKEAMAQYFWDHYHARIARFAIRHLFFESGSTIAYVSAQFHNLLKTSRGGEHRSLWRLRTNNLLSYLEFVLWEHLHVDLVPHGPPEDTYGATFGALATLPQWPAPMKNESLSKYDPAAVPIVDSVARMVVPADHPALILATASGLDLNHEQFPGLHVGSYHNNLFKRALLKSGAPVVFFFDESKIAPFSPQGQFKLGKCHSVCDPELPWADVCREVPLGLCIGATSMENIKSIVSLLGESGFFIDSHMHEYDHGYAVMLVNKVFSERFGKAANDQPDLAVVEEGRP